MASAALILSLIAGAVALVGVTGAFFDWLTPLGGFQLFLAGALLGGLLSTVAGLIGILLTRGGQDPKGRTRSLVGLAIGLGLMILVLGPASLSPSVPAINDITTDLDNPPAFTSPIVVSDYVGRDMRYPEAFKSIVREAYPDLAPLIVTASPRATFVRALALAESFGWEIVAQSDSQGVFDAQDRSSIFHFIDDITIRVAAKGAGARIDMRSKSRDGKSDLGANAARIRAYLGSFDRAD
ncbi:MAG: DUF1499 domain-containing protein [Myxococcota bacterium]